MPSHTNLRIDWPDSQDIGSHRYHCGYCRSSVASNRGFIATDPSGLLQIARIYICHFCGRPTFLETDLNQVPGPPATEPVSGITDVGVSALLHETSESFSAGAYTSAVMCCRTILMYVAVDNGADRNQPFLHYIQYLLDERLLPSSAKSWVDHIRSQGNIANHEIHIFSRDDARIVLDFIVMLLKIIYEYPSKAPRVE